MAEDGSKNCNKKIVVRWYSLREMLFKLSHENTGLEALHFHGKVKQFKVRLPLALAKLSKQSIFHKVERLIWVVADVKSVQNIPKDLLGQAGKGIGIFKFLRFDFYYCKLGLAEVEPNMRFLLIEGQSLTWEVAAAATGWVKCSKDMFARLKKVGKAQMFGRPSSHKE
jgi:hypothetical protein